MSTKLTSPRVVVEPYRDEHGALWTRHRFQDPAAKEDLFVVDLKPEFAKAVARDVLSLEVL